MTRTPVTCSNGHPVIGYTYDANGWKTWCATCGTPLNHEPPAPRRPVNWRAVAIRCICVAAVAGVAAIQWWITTPRVVTYAEFRAILLLGGVALIITLSATWVSRAPDDHDTYTHRDNRGQ